MNPSSPSPVPIGEALAPPGASAVMQEAVDRTQWFHDEIHPHGKSLKAFLRSQYPTVRDIDDVVQESFLRVWKARAVQPIQSAKAFLFRVARHLALDLIRRESRNPVSSTGDVAALAVMEDRPGVAEVLTEQEKISLVGDAIVALPARTRDIFILHRFKGLTQAEVARQLGISEKAVEHQVARGIQLCEDYLRARGHELF